MFCQGRQTPDWLDHGYVVHSRRPSSPVRLCPSTIGLDEREIGIVLACFQRPGYKLIRPQSQTEKSNKLLKSRDR